MLRLSRFRPMFRPQNMDPNTRGFKLEWGWRVEYHRRHLTRQHQLRLHKERLQRKKAAEKRLEEGHGTQPFRYNRFWVNHNLDFVAQETIVEDPDVIQRRKTTLPEPTKETLWKKPHAPFMEPLLPFIRVVDYPKDPDVKYLKPTNIPRWKDFMVRNKPMIPRTWY